MKTLSFYMTLLEERGPRAALSCLNSAARRSPEELSVEEDYTAETTTFRFADANGREEGFIRFDSSGRVESESFENIRIDSNLKQVAFELKKLIQARDNQLKVSNLALRRSEELTEQVEAMQDFYNDLLLKSTTTNNA